MRKSGYRTVFHIYLIFFLVMLGAILAASGLLFLLITVRRPDGSLARSNWPQTFAGEFREEIMFDGGAVRVSREGIRLLRDNGVGLQILDSSGADIANYQKPELARETYSRADLLRLSRDGRWEDEETTAFIGSVTEEGEEYLYILYVPVNISKVTMYLNGERFAGGKAVILPVLGCLFLAVVISGLLYGILTTRAMRQVIISVGDVSARSYLPVQKRGVFRDLYSSLNGLDEQIRASDRLKEQTDRMREEWIANITHDLKTPLSPIRGYAEVLLEDGGENEAQVRQYAGIVLKNASYMECLIDDLKLTYQLENGMLPLRAVEGDVVRFLRELAIDILNAPDYEERTIRFEAGQESVRYPFDPTLFERAFRNLVINAFVHGNEDTEVTLRVWDSDGELRIEVADNGAGMGPEACEHLFDRYYRGENTGQKPEGTGLGLAIAKGMIELHGGTISVASAPGAGSVFRIVFPHA